MPHPLEPGNQRISKSGIIELPADGHKQGLTVHYPQGFPLIDGQQHQRHTDMVQASGTLAVIEVLLDGNEGPDSNLLDMTSQSVAPTAPQRAFFASDNESPHQTPVLIRRLARPLFAALAVNPAVAPDMYRKAATEKQLSEALADLAFALVATGDMANVIGELSGDEQTAEHRLFMRKYGYFTAVGVQLHDAVKNHQTMSEQGPQVTAGPTTSINNYLYSLELAKPRGANRNADADAAVLGLLTDLADQPGAEQAGAQAYLDYHSRSNISVSAGSIIDTHTRILPDMIDVERARGAVGIVAVFAAAHYYGNEQTPIWRGNSAEYTDNPHFVAAGLPGTRR